MLSMLMLFATRRCARRPQVRLIDFGSAIRTSDPPKELIAIPGFRFPESILRAYSTAC
jgi:hypothetical protein